jgi:hypothetical protein
MRKSAGVLGLAALAAWICGNAAYAGGMSDEQCAEHVAQECDPIPFVQCFDDPGMWDRINPDCTAYVQTNLENAREADQ